MSTTVDRDLLRAERSARIRTERLRRQMPLLAYAGELEEVTAEDYLAKYDEGRDRIGRIQRHNERVAEQHQLWLELFRAWGIELRGPGWLPRWRGLADPVYVADWLRSTAEACGLICRRWPPSGLEVGP